MEGKRYTSYPILKLLVEMDENDDMKEWEERGKRVTIDLDEVIVRSDGTKATMREFVKEMLYYNPDFHIEKDEIWVLRRKKKQGE